MSSCITDTCGTGDWTGPKPGDPDNNSILSANPAFGGIDVSWTYPTINPHAVAHVIIYRGITNNYAASVRQATVAGNTYYDKITGTAGMRYYYWIQIVSINGTIGTVIGPASAVARTRIEDTIVDLTGQIENSSLGLSLRTSVGKITDNYNELLGKIGAFSGNNAAFMAALAQLQSGLTGALTLINTEITQRTSGQNALAAQQSVIAALNNTNAAAILEEKFVRVTATDALAIKIEDVQVANRYEMAAAVKTIESSKIGYSARATTEEPYEGNGSFVVYPVTGYPAASFPEYALNRTRIIDKQGVTNWNAGNTLQLKWVVGLPLAQAIKSVGISDGDSFLTLEQRALAQKKANGDLYGQYTVKIDTNGYIAGFGLSSTTPLKGPATSDFIVNADTFAIAGPTIPGKAVSKIAPFIVKTSTGEVFINNAVINQLTSDKIDTRGLTIKDDAGNIIFGSGYKLGVTNITGLGQLATQNGVNYDVVVGPKPPTDADNTASNTAAGINGQGALATKNKVVLGSDITFPDGSVINSVDLVTKLSKINSGNISTFIDGLAVTNAYIGNAEVSTLKIEGNAVTVPSSGISGCSLTLTEPGYVFVSASAWMYENSGSDGGAVTAAFSMQINCSNGGAGGYVITHSAKARHITASTGECFYLGAGSWSFYVSTSDIEGGYTYMGGYITAVGAMR